MDVIDVNVSFGNWPFQKFLQDRAAKLSRHLKSEGISLALVSSIESVFYSDPDVYNRLLLEKLKPDPSLSPVMVFNPFLSGWKQRLAEYTDSREIKAVKILPNYHNYSLSSPSVEELVGELIRRKMLLIIQMRMEDERNQYPLLKVAGVEFEQVIKLANRFPQASILCLCPYYQEAIALVKETDNVYVDISFTEQLDTVVSLLKEIPASRVLFGSHTPFLYTRSAVMKIKSADISKKNLKAIMFNNASHLLKLEKL